jgi:excisionase family DNA binding protein
MQKNLISTREAAEMLGCSEKTVRNMITRGSLKASKIDPQSKSVYKIQRSDVESILKVRAGAAKTAR